jgi:hypothetical protein
MCQSLPSRGVEVKRGGAAEATRSHSFGYGVTGRARQECPGLTPWATICRLFEASSPTGYSLLNRHLGKLDNLWQNGPGERVSIASVRRVAFPL